MINAYKSAALFRERYGDSFDEQQVTAHCLTAAIELENKIKSGADRDDIRLRLLAAATAYLRLTRKTISEEGQITSFKAGDVSVTSSPAAQVALAENEFEEAKLQAAPLLRDDAFLLMGI